MRKMIWLSLVLLGMNFVKTQNIIITSDSLARQDSIQSFILEYDTLLNNKMDSLLSSWYIKCVDSNCFSIAEELDSADIEPLNDSLILKNLLSLHTPIPLAYNDIVKHRIELYLTKRKRSSSIILGLGQYYYPWMREIFDQYGVPEELIYLTIVESALNPTAVSRAGATGIWQFMYRTGKAYGLDQNTFMDDRRDPYKATDAAARHLRDLHNIFDDWGLAIAAYNCGSGNVRKAIARSGGKRDFWSIKRFLPRETQNYFPTYIAAYYLAEFHLQHGITPIQCSIPQSVDTVMVQRELHFGQLAQTLNIDIEEIKALNPQYKKMVIPAYQKAMPLRLQNDDVLYFIQYSDSIYNYRYNEFFAPVQVDARFFGDDLVDKDGCKKIFHIVRSGETMGGISHRYGLTVTELKKMNGLSSTFLRVKQCLVVGYEYVPKPPTPPVPAKVDSIPKCDSLVMQDSLIMMVDSLIIQDSIQIQHIANPVDTISKKDTLPMHRIALTNETSRYAPSSLGGHSTTHIVRKGDSLGGIAKKYGVSVKRIADYNGIYNPNSLKVGQKIKIPKQ